MREQKGNRTGKRIPLVILTTLISAVSVGQALGGGGGSGGSGTSSDWQINPIWRGFDTYVFPKYDSSQGAYRLYTYTREWITGNWYLDGNYISGAGFSNAAWNTPTSFTGYAESKGTVDVNVKWVGSGAAPTYCYLMLNSGANASDQSESAATISVSDGQGDPAIISSGSGTCSGIHAKRLKLNASGEATYTVALNAKAQKTGTSGSLVASTGLSTSIDAKALSLFIETFKRTHVQAGDHETVHADPAWTGDIEHESAEIGTNGGFAPTIPVFRIGNWSRPDLNFTSGINKGFRIENYDTYLGFPTCVISITCEGSYSNDQLVAMRKTPDVVVLNASQSDSGSTIPGPFNTSLSMKVWAVERIIDVVPYNADTTIEPNVVQPGGTSVLFIGAGSVGHQKFTHSSTYNIGGKVGLVRGTSGTIGITDLVSLGVKADTNVELNFSWAESNSEETWYDWPAVNYDRYIHFKLTTRRRNADRTLASYGADGYDGDFTDTVTDIAQPTGLFWWTTELSW